MKLISVNGRYVEVSVSRRNLLTLLYKLDKDPTSRCTLEITGDAGFLSVKAEKDEVHYKDREPGRMHPDIETYMRQFDADAGQKAARTKAAMRKKLAAQAAAPYIG